MKEGAMTEKAVNPVDPGRGQCDPRNTLNDLTGREWVYFLNSVEVTAYPVSGPESYGHDLRKVHPSPKPPQLMARLIEFFTKRGGWVLDPFVGVGGTLLGCSLTGRHGVGIDLNPDYVSVYKEVCRREGLAEQAALVADARHLDELPEVRNCVFDLILTDPPYCDMMARRKTGQKKKRKGAGSPTPFTDNPKDLGNLAYDEFLEELRGILARSLQFLKDKGYLVLFCKDFQPTREYDNLLHADVVRELYKVPGLSFKGYKIWYDRTITLYPFGYPYTYVSNQLHQFILIFRKELRSPGL